VRRPAAGGDLHQDGGVTHGLLRERHVQLGDVPVRAIRRLSAVEYTDNPDRRGARHRVRGQPPVPDGHHQLASDNVALAEQIQRQALVDDDDISRRSRVAIVERAAEAN